MKARNVCMEKGLGSDSNFSNIFNQCIILVSEASQIKITQIS